MHFLRSIMFCQIDLKVLQVSDLLLICLVVECKQNHSHVLDL